MVNIQRTQLFLSNFIDYDFLSNECFVKNNVSVKEKYTKFCHFPIGFEKELAVFSVNKCIVTMKINILSISNVANVKFKSIFARQFKHIQFNRFYLFNL